MNSELMEKLESLLNKFQERALSLREEYSLDYFKYTIKPTIS